jgi:hypothetical protein
MAEWLIPIFVGLVILALFALLHWYFEVCTPRKHMREAIAETNLRVGRRPPRQPDERELFLTHTPDAFRPGEIYSGRWADGREFRITRVDQVGNTALHAGGSAPCFAVYGRAAAGVKGPDHG